MDFTYDFVRFFAIGLLRAFPLLVFLALWIAGIGLVIGRREGWSRSDALYFSFVTATTLGYGDFRPTRRSTKFLAVTTALIGIIFTGIIVAIALHSATRAFDTTHASTTSSRSVLHLFVSSS